MKINVLKKGWSLLDRHERRSAILTILAIILSAASSAAMVGSIMPFLSILADPNRIRDTPLLFWVYEAFGFASDYSFLVATGLASLTVILFANAIHVFRVYLVTKFSTMRMHSFSSRLLQTYLRQPYEYFLDENSGDLSTQILAETQKVVELFYRPVAEAIAALFTSLAVVALLIWINPLVASIVLFLPGLLLAGAFVLSRTIVRGYGDERASTNRLRFRAASEALGGVKEIKLLGREAVYLGRYSTPSLRMATSESTAIFISTLPQYVMQIVTFGGMILLVLALVDPAMVSQGRAINELLPLLGVFAFGGQRLIPELGKIFTGISIINFGTPVVDAIYKDLEREHKLPPLPSLDCAPIHLKRELELQNVTYCYPNSESAVLVSVSFRILAGERIGIVGGSGAGKTTLADVMMGLLRANSGQILVDGVTITENNVAGWQRSVGYVQQDIFLSDSSILENIALGVPLAEIDRERAIDAARTARLDDFVVESLPSAYETIVGERGIRLSGGQRQRIGIARALYHKADFIVFDEATSALDNITEKQVMKSIEALPGNKTAILIAHRLSTLAKCDRLIVMEQGRVVGIGTWAELLANNAYFQALAAGSLKAAAVAEQE